MRKNGCNRGREGGREGGGKREEKRGVCGEMGTSGIERSEGEGEGNGVGKGRVSGQSILLSENTVTGTCF